MELYPNRYSNPRRQQTTQAKQQTMLTEFYVTTTMESPGLEEYLEVWVLDHTYCRVYYCRVYGSLGKTPMERRPELREQTPF